MGRSFTPLKEAQIVIEQWRVEDNTQRPHSSPPEATNSNFTANGCDVDSLTRRGTKTRAGHVEISS